ncbi:MAG: hypothetical protein J5483_07800 [Lachnospiraceae bacterium]|nr:hypothetical protein [Lachnospiraceae bacterium]
MKKKRSGSRRKLFLILVLVVVVFGCAFLGLQIYNLKKQNTELKARKERLTELLSEEVMRSQALEEEKVYIQTQKYIEEKAKSIGYVYPDEIIFRKEN